ncbi:MAG: hypothetical protein AB7I27_14795 [Bacteriovoracaceae bacterium]
MRKTILFLFTLLFFISCGGHGGGGGKDLTLPNSSEATGTPVTMEETTPDSPLSSSALNFNVNVTFLNFNASQEDKVLLAAELIKKVVSSEEFKNAVLNHTYNGKKAFASNGGLSNAQIYKKILEGSETLNPGIDNEMDMQLEIYQEATTTIGYTFPNTEKIWMNNKYFNQYSAKQVTVNMMHEWLHKLGFVHDYAATAARPYSVPYAIGYLVGDLAQKYQ